MTRTDLIHMTRLYARDNNSYMFSDTMITLFLNQAIDRIRQYPYFKEIPYLNFADDEPNPIPQFYHYMLALFAASRCFEHDERFYEATEKRNEFEQLLENLIAEVQCGNIVLTDDEGNKIDDGTNVIEYVVDTYYKRPKGGDEDANTILEE